MAELRHWSLTSPFADVAIAGRQRADVHAEAEGKRRGDLIPVDALAFDFVDLTTSSVRLCSVASACRGKPSSSAAMRPSSWPSLRRTAASRVASLPFCHRKFGHS